MFPSDLRSPNHVGVGTRIAGVVQGYRPQVDWGGDTGSAKIVLGNQSVRVATEGWRRRCLYILLLALLVQSIVNLSLTLWILKTVYFSVDGMGPLHVEIGGVHMEGITEFLGKLSVHGIQSKKDENLPLQGYHNLTMTATSEQGGTGFMHINTRGIEGGSRSFVVKSPREKEPLLRMTGDSAYVGANTLIVTGNKGGSFNGSIQTPYLLSRGAYEFKLESVTRRIHMRGPKEVRVEARSGDVTAAALADLKIIVVNGSLRLDNPTIYFTSLKKVEEKVVDELPLGATVMPQETQIPAPETRRRGGRVGAPPTTTTTPLPPSTPNAEGMVQVFQVCACPSGRLFLSPANSTCVFEENICR